jgi:predicted acyl esterase
MWGGSYAGFDQWATLKGLPPHLATVVPVASVHAGLDFPFYKGVWADYDMQWLTFTSGNTGNENLFGEGSFWNPKFRKLYLEQRPFNTLDQIVGNTSTVFQKWLELSELRQLLGVLGADARRVREDERAHSDDHR